MMLHTSLLEKTKTTFRTNKDIAQKFNKDFNCDDFLKVPEPLMKNFARIMSLKDGLKMSKSILQILVELI